ncbi:hypothetical protein GCM10010435_62050 [Winogradskya consettensis]|uniref:Uncharacterized protein n=1 Tax=Winogradskya consettensis TaxID=113560 RepID=A0A919SR39_9ACTN|nr:hypothetical protein [Actinoplanes consettensis]GIM76071.1 hypothetical protein Aco04nite_48500 [Actinoplanes consettensis]
MNRFKRVSAALALTVAVTAGLTVASQGSAMAATTKFVGAFANPTECAVQAAFRSWVDGHTYWCDGAYLYTYA